MMSVIYRSTTASGLNRLFGYRRDAPITGAPRPVHDVAGRAGSRHRHRYRRRRSRAGDDERGCVWCRGCDDPVRRQRRRGPGKHGDLRRGARGATR